MKMNKSSGKKKYDTKERGEITGVIYLSMEESKTLVEGLALGTWTVHL